MHTHYTHVHSCLDHLFLSQGWEWLPVPLICCHAEYPLPSFRPSDRETRLERSRHTSRKRQRSKTEETRRVQDERRLRRHLPDRNPDSSSPRLSDTQTQKQEEQNRENDLLALPTVNDAKMIIMPESLQWCQKSIAISHFRRLANTIST